MTRHLDKDGSIQGISIKGLSEREFHSIYNVGQVLRLNTGSSLVQEGVKEESLFLVLKGRIQIDEDFSGLIQETVFREGDWIGGGIGSEQPGRTRPLVAGEPSSVLVLDPSALQNLDLKIQNFIWKKLHETSVRRTHCLEDNLRHLSSANKRQVIRMGELLQGRTRGYEQAEVILNILKSVPRLPVHVSKLIQMLSMESSSAREVTHLAMEDPSLAGEILKAVNSSYYSLQRRISDLSYAIVYLGFNQVYHIVISNGLQKVMPRTPRFDELYQHSVIIAHLAFEIGQLCDRRKSSTMGTIALLHEIGENMVLLLKAQNPRWSFIVDMLEPAKVAAMLLKDWNIPDSICQTVEYQYYPEFLPPQEIPTPYRDHVAVLYVAHAAYDYLGGGEEEFLKHLYLQEYLRFLKLPEASIGALVDKYVLTDLNMKIHTLPKHVRSFILRGRVG